MSTGTPTDAPVTASAGAPTPAGIVARWGRAANDGDAEALLSVYGPGAVLVTSPSDVISDRDGIREAMGAFVGLDPVFEETVLRVIEAGDTALVIADWAFTGTGPDGAPVRDSGRSTTITRRQDDGSWLFLVDNPKGTAA